MSRTALTQKIQSIIATDPRYSMQAYRMILEALEVVVSRAAACHQELKDVSAVLLAHAFREELVRHFGPFALAVAHEAGLHTSRDLGEVVFNLVNAGILRKQPQESASDFDDLFDFEEVFHKPFIAQS